MPTCSPRTDRRSKSSIGSAVEMLFLSATLGTALLAAVAASLDPKDDEPDEPDEPEPALPPEAL